MPARARPLIERLARRAFDAAAAAAFVVALTDERWEQAEAWLDAPDPSGARIASLIDRVVRGCSSGWANGSVTGKQRCRCRSR